SFDFIEVKQIFRVNIENLFYLLKLPSEVTTAKILDLKLLQAFAMVSLLKDPITSLIFEIRALV
ncbi:MAG: hypothetical protein ACK55Z_14955, partial [bacterium]